MATTYNRNAYSVDVVVYSAFNRTTGAASNIDDVIAAANPENVIYNGGSLLINNQTVAVGDYIGIDDGNNPVRIAATEIAANYTAA